MNVYTVAAVLDSRGGITAGVSGGMSWVGAYDPSTNTYLIATPDPPTPKNCTQVTDLQQECAKRGLQVSDVLKWRC